MSRRQDAYDAANRRHGEENSRYAAENDRHETARAAQDKKHEEAMQEQENRRQSAETSADDARQLTIAVTHLAEVVEGLQGMIREDYPKREEIEKTFVTKYNVRRRRKQLMGAMLLAIVASYVFTVGTVSYCFLGGSTTANSQKSVCYFIPGYGGVVDYNKNRLETYNKYFSDIDKLNKRVADLENAAK